MRLCLVLCWIVAAFLCPLASLRQAQAQEGAPTEALPIIVTYELKKQRREARTVVQNPKAFWMRQIVARIEDKKQDFAKLLKEPVTVQVTFVVGRNGRIVSKALSKPSGNAEADGMAIAMLDRAQPFPPMPAAMGGTELTFTMPVRFRGAVP